MEKIKLTKEYVKKQYCTNFLFTELFDIFIFASDHTLLIVWLRIMAQKEFFTNIAAYLPLAFFALLTFAYVVHFSLQFKNLSYVLRGKFHICSDELVKREPPKYCPRRRYFSKKVGFYYNEGLSYRLYFKTYGVHKLYRTTPPFEKGSVSPKKQYDEAYLGDIYFVAVVKGEIVCAYNSKYYTL